MCSSKVVGAVYRPFTLGTLTLQVRVGRTRKDGAQSLFGREVPRLGAVVAVGHVRQEKRRMFVLVDSACVCSPHAAVSLVTTVSQQKLERRGSTAGCCRYSTQQHRSLLAQVISFHNSCVAFTGRACPHAYHNNQSTTTLEREEVRKAAKTSRQMKYSRRVAHPRRVYIVQICLPRRD